LCEEFGFSEFAAKLSAFRASMVFQKVEEKAEQHDRDIVILQDELRQLSTNVGRLAGEVSALRSASARESSAEVSALRAQNAALSACLLCLQGHSGLLRSSRRWVAPPFDLQIVSAFRRSSESSKRSGLCFCGAAAAMVSKRKNFTADAIATQTL
jgi:hypothetical protein